MSNNLSKLLTSRNRFSLRKAAIAHSGRVVVVINIAKEVLEMVSCRDLLNYISGESEDERKRAACKNLAAGLLLGAVLGAAAGILFAPRAGRETRRAIAAKTADAVERFKESVSEYREELMEHLEKPESERNNFENMEPARREPGQQDSEAGTP